MQNGLAESLCHIQERCVGKLPFDHAGVMRIVAEIQRGRRFPPSTFALYYDLVPALLGDDEATVLALFDALARERPVDASLQVLGLDDPALRACRERYVRFMNSDPSCPFDFLPPAPEQIDAFNRQFDRACDLLRQASPKLLEEMRAIISQVILVMGSKGARMQFDGGSAYRLWGALFLNAERHQTRIELAEVLAHESGHSVLFGLSTEEVLVLNPDEELFDSPLRIEPRPMDGVFHATYVSARMHWAMSRLIASGLLTEEECAQAVKARAEDRRNFENGYAIVAAHARLTKTGRTAIESALSYMRQAA
ncbi:aKG-HExxH-type peptide beta-hydroxylase [Dongia deserti]|uniref:aKG-HExxH-type peptide beta-hydroxylase n=1 Tax=Dongia deserti TaxID=2268030 RepID=UPI00254740ED|nr:HEXXH motif-containing putative peptide modification protein [Dongia deserti]